VLDRGFEPTDRGTPQGGIASPLLALIALHGLETHIRALGTKANPIHAVFYADDFVVIASRESDVHRAKAAIAQWLQGVGLELHPEKTKLSHTLNGQAGFEFLGFEIRQYVVGKYQSKRGYRTFTRPSKSSEKRHYQALAAIVSTHRAGTQAALIQRLNPVITGWCNYYAAGASKQRFSKMSHRLFNRLWRWAKRRHPNLNRHQIASRYWLVNQGGGWVFQTPDDIVLRRHWDTPIRRHTKVRGDKSPFDGDWAYWGTRAGAYPDLSPLKARLLKQQQGKCSHRGLFFMSEDRIEVHHRDRDAHNTRSSNLTLLHRHCHDQVHGSSDKT
jgi:RNA-directed DNA polymerase